MPLSKAKISLSCRIAAAMLVALICSGMAFAQSPSQKRVLSELPNQKVNDFYQDNDHYVWISTDYGICRYNGTDYVNYFHSGSDSTSISSNKVICSRQDSKGRLWVLTDAGVCRFDRSTEQFKNILTDKRLVGMHYLDDMLLCYGDCGFVCINTSTEAVSIHGADNNEGICFATVQNGSFIWAVSAKDKSISCYDMTFNKVNKLSPELTGKVVCAAFDEDVLWLGTEAGIKLYDTVKEEFITKDIRLNKFSFLNNDHIAVIFPYENSICVCARNRDIHIWNKTGKYTMSNLALRRFFNLSYTSDFSCALYSNDKQLWIGTSDRGYAIYNPNEIEFCSSKSLKRITKGKYFNYMTTAPDSIIWMASRYKGLMSVDAVKGSSIWYKFIDDPELKKLGDTGLSTVFCDNTKTLWLNMENKLALASFSGLKLGHVRLLDTQLSSNAICQDHDGNVWIAAKDGLYRFRDHVLQDRKFYGSNICDVTCDSKGTVYCSVDGVGIKAISPETYKSEPVFTEHAFTKDINSIRFHPDGSVWFATRSEGLYVISGDKLKHYGQDDNNLRSTDVESIVFDKKGNAWLGTSYGLSLLKNGSSEIISYGMNESLQVQQFTSRCTAVTGDFVCLGGVSGVALFPSARLISKISDEPVEVKISSIKSHGRVLTEYLKDGIDDFNSLRTISIPYKDRNLTIDYESVQYFHPEAVKYAFRLKGVDKEWNYVDEVRSATWSYLPSGRYRFELIAQNYDGFWNATPKTLEIVIKPSPFLAWYSILIYIVLLAAIIYSFMVITINRKVQNKKLELTMEALEQEKKMAKMKVGFFTNISHELRTSLSLIYAPVSMLDKADEAKRKDIISLVRSNTSSLLVLIDQLLNISRIENDCMPLMISDVDIIPYINRIIKSFSTLADAKMIDLRLINEIPDGTLLPIDADKLQKVLQNLLSNAIKYTERGGQVDVRMNISDNILKVSVIDDGIGMKPEDAKVVFERYRRLKSSEITSKGSGIGLHYAKQLVLLHKGHIEAIVRDCGGMEFRFEIPVSPEAYSASERQDVAADIIDGFLTVEAENEAATTLPENHDASKPLVAIIEDSPQLSSYLKGILSEDFRVVTASNGAEGLDLINAEMPDIITTDVMMEGMDGYELCRRVKDSPILSHIPVVILTAKVAEEDKLAGYKNKANAYITKPFNPELLVAVMRNLIEETEKLRKDILSHNSDQSAIENSKISEHDSKFITRLNTIINEHISEPLIDTSELAEMLQVSRSGLFRKMKALTGVTPNEYIIIYKLNRSVEILKKGDMNISEVSYSLGFSSPSHFSNTFKNRFGVSPKNYLQK